MDFADNGYQEDLIDARRQAVQLHPDVGAGMPDGEKRISLLRNRCVRKETVLCEQCLGSGIALHGRPVLEPDGFVHHRHLRLRVATQGREAGCEEAEKYPFHRTVICLQR